MAINSDGQGSDGPTPEASAPETSSPEASPDTLSIDALLAAGRHADAAMRARAQGEPLRAAAIYERIWEFGRAAACAREGGDLPRALRNAIDARDEALVVELAGLLEAQGREGLRAAMQAFAQRRRFGDAGERAEAAGELDAAIELYRQAHRELDAARLLAGSGRDREAGRLLERMIAVAALVHTFILGLIWGTLVAVTGRLAPSIVAHTLANAGFGLLLLSGYKISGS